MRVSGCGKSPDCSWARHGCRVARYDVQTTWPGRQYDGCTLAHSAPGTTGHNGGVITIQVSSLDIWISLTNDMSYRGSTIPTMPNSNHQPRRAQCGGGECCRLQDDLYCFLGKLQESTIARAVTRHGHTHLVCRWSGVLSDALLLSYTFCIVAVLLDSLDMNLRLGTFMVYWY